MEEGKSGLQTVAGGQCQELKLLSRLLSFFIGFFGIATHIFICALVPKDLGIEESLLLIAVELRAP